jgi:hypothetical protein
VGANKRITAMLTRETIKLTKLTLLPSGRGMAALCRDVWTVKIYAPSGSSNRQEKVFTVWKSLIASKNDHRVNFNYVLTDTGCTANMNFNKYRNLPSASV